VSLDHELECLLVFVKRPACGMRERTANIRDIARPRQGRTRGRRTDDLWTENPDAVTPLPLRFAASAENLLTPEGLVLRGRARARARARASDTDSLRAEICRRNIPAEMSAFLEFRISLRSRERCASLRAALVRTPRVGVRII